MPPNISCKTAKLMTMAAGIKTFDKIFLRGLKFFGRHGVLKAEAQLGQPFLVDVELSTCLRKAGMSDNVKDTVDYSRVFDIVKDVIEGGGGSSIYSDGHKDDGDSDGNSQRRCNLVETLATRIAAGVLNDCRMVDEVTVTVSKPHVAFPATLTDVGVEIRRTRKDLLDLPS